MKRIYKRICTASLTFGWTAFVFRNSFKSKAESAKQSSFLAEAVKKVLATVSIDSSDWAVVLVRKTAHVVEFFVLAMLMYFAARAFGLCRKKSLITASVYSAICACIDETVQIFSHRGPAVTDVLIDCLGVALFAASAWIVNNRRKKT